MSLIKSLTFGSLLLCSASLLAQAPAAKTSAVPKADDALAKIVRESSEKFADEFNAGKADEVANLFLAEGEYIDEEGTVYQGRKEIKALLTAFFAKFAGTKLSINIESMRLVGPVAIEEGTRTMTAKDGSTQSTFRYIAIRTKADDGWKIASFRDVANDAVPTSNEALQPLAWLAGDWVNEGADGAVALSFKWSEDKNFLLADFQMKSADGASKKSSQRFGWDPSTGKIRTWLFDSDGGFAEGLGTLTQEGVVIKFSSVNPDGSTGSATITIAQKDKGRFSMKGTDRVVGDSREPDFELDVVRRPPAAGK